MADLITGILIGIPLGAILLGIAAFWATGRARFTRRGPVRHIIMVMLAALISGCGVHSVWNVSDREAVQSYAKAEPHSNPVFVTRAGLMPGQYDTLAQIDLSRNTCEGDTKVMKVMANQARQHGCDAVIEVDIWYKPSLFGECDNAPHASGQCVKLPDKDVTQRLDGFWF